MERLNRALTTLFCLGLCLAAAAETLSTSPPHPAIRANLRPAHSSSQLRGDERILHALNRFTFGARPEDVEAVRSIGLEKWFERQLHPASLDQKELDARLAQFPAMQQTPQELLLHFPSNAVINQTQAGKLPMPAPAPLRAVYEAQMLRLQIKKQQQGQKKADEQKGSQNASMQTVSAMKPQQDAIGLSAAAKSTGAPEVAADDSAVRRVVGFPPQQRVDQLNSMKAADLNSFFQALKGPQRNALMSGLDPASKEQVIALENPQRIVPEELIAERLTRDIYSSAQLQEVMTDFWLNHFNVFLHKNEETPYYLVAYERDTIRPRALGKFEDLLVATAQSPAMLLYLDNAASMGPDSPAAERSRQAAEKHPGNAKKAPEGLNENYARELMELHTLSVRGGYTQQDVTQVARIFTGWTVDHPQLGGAFKFDASRHEPGDKKVLGKKIKENGELEGQELLHLLAARPATAQFLARKLAVRFVSDDPPQSLVDRMAKSYRTSGGDIAAVLKTLFHSPEFWASSAYRSKVKTPLEFVASAVRSSNAAVSDLQPLANAVRDMGMPVYGSVPPTGYNWKSATWVSTGALVNRMNFALTLAANKLSGTTVNWASAQDAKPSGATPAANAGSDLPSVEQEESRLEALLVAGGVSSSTRSAVLQQTSQAAPLGTATTQAVAAVKPISRSQQAANLNKADQQMAGLLLGSPEFQRR